MKVYREECERKYVDSPVAWVLSVLYWGGEVAVGDYKFVKVWAKISVNIYAKVDGV